MMLYPLVFCSLIVGIQGIGTPIIPGGVIAAIAVKKKRKQIAEHTRAVCMRVFFQIFLTAGSR